MQTELGFSYDLSGSPAPISPKQLGYWIKGCYVYEGPWQIEDTGIHPDREAGDHKTPTGYVLRDCQILRSPGEWLYPLDVARHGSFHPIPLHPGGCWCYPRISGNRDSRDYHRRNPQSGQEHPGCHSQCMGSHSPLLHQWCLHVMFDLPAE